MRSLKLFTMSRFARATKQIQPSQLEIFLSRKLKYKSVSTLPSRPFRLRGATALALQRSFEEESGLWALRSGSSY